MLESLLAGFSDFFAKTGIAELFKMADLGGIRYIVSDMEDEALAKRLRMEKFSPEKNPDAPKICERYKYFLDLNGYFTTGCC